NETVIIAINRADKEKKVDIPAGSIGLRDGGELSSLIGAVASSRVENRRATISVPSKTVTAYIVR
ncbi:MAG: hypothetical protein ABJB21_09855, partial [bacterium]